MGGREGELRAVDEDGGEVCFENPACEMLLSHRDHTLFPGISDVAKQGEVDLVEPLPEGDSEKGGQYLLGSVGSIGGERDHELSPLLRKWCSPSCSDGRRVG